MRIICGIVCISYLFCLVVCEILHNFSCQLIYLYVLVKLQLLHVRLALVLLKLKPDLSRIPLLPLSEEYPLEYLQYKHCTSLLAVVCVEIGNYQGD